MLYRIHIYNLIGKILKTYEEIPGAKKITGQSKWEDKYVDANGRELIKSHHWEYSESKGDAIPDTEKFLPYFADVTEDLPAYMLHGPAKVKPKTYKNCQLLSEKHGGYLQFYDHKTEEIHRIAMNSNYYHPVENGAKKR